MPAGKINVTDPDSRNVKTPRGYMQGYNAQAVCNDRQIVVAAEISVASPDFGQLEPMIAAAERELAAAGVTQNIEVALADAGYWHQEQMDSIVSRGIQVLIPPDAGKRKGARPGWDGGLYAFMRRVLDTEHGGGLYRKRQGMIEPRLRRHQVQPSHRPLPASRQIGCPLGMADDHRHRQPAQASPPPPRARHSLSGPQNRRTASGRGRNRYAWMRDPLAVPEGELLTHSPRAAA